VGSESIRWSRATWAKLTGYQGSQPDSVTDLFVFLATDESKAVTRKMLSSSGWKSQVKLN
jgi:hypothetical protein